MATNPKSMCEHVFEKNTMVTPWDSILSSSCCCLFEKCARDPASLGASGHVDNHLFCCEGDIFSKPCSELFF